MGEGRGRVGCLAFGVGRLQLFSFRSERSTERLEDFGGRDQYHHEIQHDAANPTRPPFEKTGDAELCVKAGVVAQRKERLRFAGD